MSSKARRERRAAMQPVKREEYRLQIAQAMQTIFGTLALIASIDAPTVTPKPVKPKAKTESPRDRYNRILKNQYRPVHPISRRTPQGLRAQ